MTRWILLTGCSWIIFAVPIQAQEPTPFQWAAHRQIPARISDGFVAANLALDAWDALYKTSARERWGFACRLGLTIGLAETVKRLIKRPRPDDSDLFSTPSEHTAVATATAGYRSPFGASIALTVAWGRQAAGKHYATDVVFGAGLGLFSQWVCK